eukprot:2486003-Prymnesium_polylepis.2
MTSLPGSPGKPSAERHRPLSDFLVHAPASTAMAPFAPTRAARSPTREKKPSLDSGKRTQNAML